MVSHMVGAMRAGGVAVVVETGVGNVGSIELEDQTITKEAAHSISDIYGSAPCGFYYFGDMT